MPSNVNIKTIPSSKLNFFKLWMEFLKPFHGLTNKEMEIVAFLLYKRDILKRQVNNDELIDKLLLDTDIRDEIRERMGYKSNQVLSNILTELRSKKILINNRITNLLIPNLGTNADNFKLVLNFNIKDED